MEYYWYNGVAGTWGSSDVLDFSVLKWNDITLAALQDIGNNQYANIWVYAEADDCKISMIYPQETFATAATAEVEAPPTDLPSHKIGRASCRKRV